MPNGLAGRRRDQPLAGLRRLIAFRELESERSQERACLWSWGSSAWKYLGRIPNCAFDISGDSNGAKRFVHDGREPIFEICDAQLPILLPQVEQAL